MITSPLPLLEKPSDFSLMYRGGIPSGDSEGKAHKPVGLTRSGAPELVTFQVEDTEPETSFSSRLCSYQYLLLVRCGSLYPPLPPVPRVRLAL